MFVFVLYRVCNDNVSKINLARGRIAVLSYHFLRRRMYSSAACSGQAQSPVAGAMHSCVGTLQFAGECFPQNCSFPWRSGPPSFIHGFLDPHESARLVFSPTGLVKFGGP